MEKTLTISVACYNVGQFLRKTLDSLIAPEIMDELEVLVVNDGSSDDTAEIAREYEEKYPQTFRLVDKANGGYGSTLNYSMPAARGRYFKQLDGDDWYNTEGLVRLVRFLRTATADIVLNGRTEVDQEGVAMHTVNVWDSLYAEKYDGQTVRLSTLEPFVYGIWVGGSVLWLSRIMMSIAIVPAMKARVSARRTGSATPGRRSAVSRPCWTITNSWAACPAATGNSWICAYPAITITYCRPF